MLRLWRPLVHHAQVSLLSRSPRYSRWEYPTKSSRLFLHGVQAYTGGSEQELSRPRYQPSYLDAIEDVEMYRPGGFYPITIGSTLGSRGRYRVLHKLGFGGSSTIWLVRDQLRESQSDYGSLVTLKILSAEDTSRTINEIPEIDTPNQLHRYVYGHGAHNKAKKYIRSIQDYFFEEGPDGNHLCVVHPFAGPSLHSLHEYMEMSIGRRHLRAEVARNVAKQVISVMQLMHSRGLVHGDITAFNILFQVCAQVHSWSDDELYSNFGEPETEEINTLDGSPPGPSAPQALTAPISCDLLCSPGMLSTDVFISDFGQSFSEDCPPKDYEPATAINYVSPEARYENRINRASDIWALGCLIFEIRAGAPLFECFLRNEDALVREHLEILGKFPDPWWSTFEERHLFFDKNGELKPKEVQEREGINFSIVKRSIRDELRRIGQGEAPLASYQDRLIEAAGTQLEETEVLLLGDLLEKMLRYSPEQRITINEVAQHPWFSL